MEVDVAVSGVCVFVFLFECVVFEFLAGVCDRFRFATCAFKTAGPFDRSE